ncbi:MAG: YihY/virulence factor BrkB family protein [Bryobacteraceae bacterium]
MQYLFRSPRGAALEEEGAETSAPQEHAPAPSDPFHAAPRVHVHTWRGVWNSIAASARFLLQTEVHVYAFAVAANILISFFPFLVAMILLCKDVLHSQAAVNVILRTVNEYFPPGFGVDFHYWLLHSYQQFSWFSVVLLLFAANGIFLPLEVAFNRVWRVPKNRSLIKNQAVSLGLIFACGVLVLASIILTATNIQPLVLRHGETRTDALLQDYGLKLFAVPATMLMIFLVYWLLPNAKIRVKRLIPASIVVGLLLEVSKYINILTWPWLRDRLRLEVPPFVQSISIILWSFIATLIVLAGAEWSARVTVSQLESKE